ncbi:MAG TPA: hypothetical protein VHX64_02630 [Caulobacteraceae bacterium]|nr:hypothetical protein [Caulobacteraceae bacterium]
MTLELDLSDLWTAPLAEEAVRRFEIAWANAIIGERTPVPGPKRREEYWALKTEAKAAWAQGDIKSLVGIGAILHRANNLNDQARRQLVKAFLTVGRYAEGRDVLVSAPATDADYWFDTACALAGLGRMPEALKAAQSSASRPQDPPTPAELSQMIGELNRRPSELDLAFGWRAAQREVRQQFKSGLPEEAVARFMTYRRARPQQLQALVEAARTPAASGESGWSGVRDAVVAWLLFGRATSAADLLLKSSARPESWMEIDEALRLAGATTVDVLPERLPELLQWAGAIFKEDAPRSFLDSAIAVLGGRADWTSVLAAAPDGAPRLVAFVATVLAAADRPQAPIALFGRLAETAKKPTPLLRELAYCSGLESTARIELKPRARTGGPRVFDLFRYNGEIEKLKIKLNEMAPWVERFVIVEAAETLSGEPRAIRLPDQQRDIAEFLPKITHVVIQRFPAHATTPWAREHYQRDEAVTALKDVCGPDDLVLISDVDEVVDRRALAGFKGLCAVLKTDLFRYFLNYRCAKASPAERGELVLLRARHLGAYSPSVARTLLADPLGPNSLEHAGWRFTAIGQAKHDGLDDKLRAGQLEAGWERCGVEELPAYVAEHRERLASVIL